MQPSELPPELERLQRDLAGRPRPEASPELRDRVMRSVRAELGQGARASAGRLETDRSRRPRSGWLTFAAGLALGVLLWMNLSLSAAQATSYDRHLPAETASVEATASRIRELLPDLPEEDVVRHALILRAGSDWAPCPSVAGLPAGGRLSRWDEFL
ncbi:MAG TPA: hypothetical protein VMY37_35060 [Thermoguttaceae bacterium]|nr:hypothetical protein [Thermoguttaceae bacterium]